MGFSRQEYRSGLPCPPPGRLPDPGIERTSCFAGRLFITGETILTCNFFSVALLSRVGIRVMLTLQKVFGRAPPFFCFFKIQKGLVLILLWIFGRIHQWIHLALDFCLLGGFDYWLISLLSILFECSASLWIGRLYVSRNVSISSRLPSLLAHNYSQ